MTYILYIWTVVAMSGGSKAYDWRPIGEYHHYSFQSQYKTAKELCDQAARDLTLGNNYRCVKSKDI